MSKYSSPVDTTLLQQRWAEHLRLQRWLDRRRRNCEYWALKAWNTASHPPEDEDPAITLANKLAVAHLYGQTLELALLRRKRAWERRSAYAQALRQASTPDECRAATRLLGE